MGKQNQNPKTKVHSEDETIADILHDLRGNRLAAINLVKMLENDAFNEETHNIEFCQSYTVKLIQKYCKDASVDSLKDHRGKAKGTAEDRAELMLAACGLLRGFEFNSNPIGSRMEAYCNYARDYNTSIKGGWGQNSLGTIYRTQLHFIEIELDADLKKVKNKNNGKLGFLSQVSRELNLPVPRAVAKPTADLPDRPKRWRQILLDISIELKKFVSSNYFSAFLGATIVIAMVKLAFFPTAPHSVPETTNYLSINSVPVEEIISEKSPFTVYPGLTVLLPLDISPDEADGTFLYCSSSDSDILYTEDGNKAWIKALEISDPKVPEAKVTVTVTPQNRASSDVFVEVPVIVDYRTYVSEPFN